MYPNYASNLPTPKSTPGHWLSVGLGMALAVAALWYTKGCTPNTGRDDIAVVVCDSLYRHAGSREAVAKVDATIPVARTKTAAREIGPTCGQLLLIGDLKLRHDR